MKRIVSLLMVLVLSFGVLSACQQKDSNSQNAVITESYKEITSEELKYYVAMLRDMVTQGMDEQAVQDLWNTPIDGVMPEDLIRDAAKEMAIKDAVLAKAAEDNSIIVSDKMMETYFTEAKDAIENDAEQYQVSVETVKKIYTKKTVGDMYLRMMYEEDDRFAPTEEQLQDFFLNHYYKAQHILIMTVDGVTRLPLSQEERDAARTKVDNILLAIKDGADFAEMMFANSEDPGLEQLPDGYVFTEGDMVVEFFEGTKALSEGEISEVIESSFGYHIIKRLPLNPETDMAVSQSDVKETYKFEEEIKLIEELKETYQISVNEAQLKEIPVR